MKVSARLKVRLLGALVQAACVFVVVAVWRGEWPDPARLLLTVAAISTSNIAGYIEGRLMGLLVNPPPA